MQGTFCANTQGIFHGNVVNFRHLGSFEKRSKVSAKRIETLQWIVTEISGFLFGGLTVLISVEELKHACRLDWQNVSTVHACWFYLEKCPSNSIVITVSKEHVCRDTKSMLNVSGMFFIISRNWLIDEWQKVWNSYHAPQHTSGSHVRTVPLFSWFFLNCPTTLSRFDTHPRWPPAAMQKPSISTILRKNGWLWTV